MDVYFSEYFDVDRATLEGYGAFDISVISDLPLFVDPFLLFHSEKPEYRALHEEILKYLRFLRDEASSALDDETIDLYCFKEVKQNWLGFTLLGNGGSGLGQDFAHALHSALGDIFRDFGDEKITKDSHLEKLCLIRSKVGRDSISDFTTNLIKAYLLRYTEKFAEDFIDDTYCERRSVRRAAFDYENKVWMTKEYYLPVRNGDFLLLTPSDLLTRDETWISQKDFLGRFEGIPRAIPNRELRGQINRYFRAQLGKTPNKAKLLEAKLKTVRKYPLLIDYYIKGQEEQGDEAVSVSSQRVDDTQLVLVEQVRQVAADLDGRKGFVKKAPTTYTEALERARWFKQYVENQDGYKLINRAGEPFSNEKEVQLFFGLVWFGTTADVNREPNNGRGPVDFKASKGAFNKALIEFKLASNSQLKRNLQKQVAVYEAANQTSSSVKVIVAYTAADHERVIKILKDIGLADDESIVLIDARDDNKPSASRT